MCVCVCVLCVCACVCVRVCECTRYVEVGSIDVLSWRHWSALTELQHPIPVREWEQDNGQLPQDIVSVHSKVGLEIGDGQNVADL